jgi:hypothetical protein
MFLKKSYNKNVAKIYECPDSGEKFGLIAINGNMKRSIMGNLQETFWVRGNHVNTGGKASELFISTLLAGGSGALGLSGASSGTLFLATANPATLMTIGNGVGSAVMGSGGIIAQAPFVPVSGAIMPVAAPLLAFQALSTIMILQQFNAINERLKNVEEKINRVLQRNEATIIGEIFSTYHRLENLERESSITNKFSNGMIIRLALIEDKVNSIFERYEYLYNTSFFGDDLNYEDLKYNQTDAYMAVTLSILDLRVDMLHLKLAIQENPGFLKHLAESTVAKVERYKELWSNVENSPLKVEQVCKSLKDAILKMNVWQKTMPSWFGGKRGERKRLEKQEDELSELNSHENTKALLDTSRDAKEFGDSLTKNTEQVSLLYWEDEFGKHSYYTNDIQIR